MERIVDDDDVRPRSKTFSLSFSLLHDVMYKCVLTLMGAEERAPADALQLGEDSAGDERYIHMRERTRESRGGSKEREHTYLAVAAAATALFLWST